MALRSAFHLVRPTEVSPREEELSAPSRATDAGVITEQGFEKFLASLDPNRDAAGRKYELLRSKLISYFDWRNCPFPEDHADEAFTRVIRKLETGDELRDASTYVFGIARMMLLEIARHKEKDRAALNQMPTAVYIDTESDETQHRIDCLRQCLSTLPQKSRELITQYYEDDGAAKIKRRKELAASLGMQLNALRIRACRVREKLEECMGRCLVSKGY
jgi:RNA polymerase sigma factor (sigma-70 family)